MNVSVRALTPADHADARALYSELMAGLTIPPHADARAQFESILAHPGTQILGAEVTGRIRAMLTLHLLPNMTQNARPYALIENVVTAADFRGLGLGRLTMNAAIARAWSQNAYKIMLLTGKKAGATGFYEKLGFDAEEKAAMTLRRVPVRGQGT